MQLYRHDSPLGSWLQARWRPAELAGVVEQIWYFEGVLAVRRERVFPNGRPELVVQIGAPYRRVEGDSAEAFSTVCVNGIMLRPEVIEAPAGFSAVVGIRFFPAGAFAVLRSLTEATNLTVDVADLVGAAAGELAERCAEAATPAGRLRAAAGWVTQRLQAHEAPTPAVVWAADEIERQRGSVSVTDLMERSGSSKTRFAERFKHEIGVPPKTFARVVRFRHAMELLHRTDRPLVEVALDAGYYDQPHFSDEFRAFGGLTPGAIRQARRYPESVNLVEA